MTNAEFRFFNNRSYIDLYPIQFGKENCKPLHSFGPSSKQNYLFHFITEGKGIFFDTENQQQFSLSKGQGFLIPPNHICSYEADQTNPWSYFWIEFNGLKVEHFLRRAGLGHKNFIYKLKNIKNSNLLSEFDFIFSHHSDNSAAIIGHFFLFIDSLIKESANNIIISHKDVKDIYIREAINYIQNNISQALSVTDIAEHCNLNRSYFCKLFKEQLTITPQQFLIQYRLNKSCELLETTQLSIAKISELVGYSNQFNFSLAFKRQYNYSPSEWRSLYLKTH